MREATEQVRAIPPKYERLPTIAQMRVSAPPTMPTLIPALDSSLGGGLTLFTTTLFSGDPGIGKSTLLLQMLHSLTIQNMKCAYFSAEESADNIALRARRIGLGKSAIHLHTASNLEEIITLLESEKINAAVIDSIQAIESETLDYPRGSISQIRECALQLVNAAQRLDVTLIIVCHVSKDGTLAGPRTIEHLTDAVLYLEAAPDIEGGPSRMVNIYAQKNRNGLTGERYPMRMTERGLISL
jgi:DNA repair protein RadA/Sms